MILQKLLTFIVPDIVHLSKDMAYKQHTMISPKMAREFLLPTYKRWGEIVLGNGCPIYAMDSDGYISGCDHGVPSDVAWPDYVYYVKLLAQSTGWL